MNIMHRSEPYVCKIKVTEVNGHTHCCTARESTELMFKHGIWGEIQWRSKVRASGEWRLRPCWLYLGISNVSNHTILSIHCIVLQWSSWTCWPPTVLRNTVVKLRKYVIVSLPLGVYHIHTGQIQVKTHVCTKWETPWSHVVAGF